MPLPGQSLQERRRSSRRTSSHLSAFSLNAFPSSASAGPPASTRSALDVACHKLQALQAATAPGGVSGNVKLDTAYLPPSPSLGHDTPSLATPSLSPEVRKKSGELVKSSLKAVTGPCSAHADSQPVSPPGPLDRDHRQGWAKSLPCTPSAKAVHFPPNLEQVKVFHHRSRPSALSSDAAAELAETETESDAYKSHPYFASLALPVGRIPTRSSPPASQAHLPRPPALSNSVPEIILRLPNFPSPAHLSASAQSRPVFLERIVLSDDLHNIHGTVQVGNLAFEKWVAVRYTYNNWEGVQEVGCTHQETIKNGAADRFEFTIRLNDLLDWPRDQAGVLTRTMSLCVRYSAAGQEHWDNNAGRNYQLDFIKRPGSTSHAPEQHGPSAADPSPAPGPPSSRLPSSPTIRGIRYTSSLNCTDYFSPRPRSHLGSLFLAPDPLDQALPRVGQASSSPALEETVSPPAGELGACNPAPTFFNGVRSWGSKRSNTKTANEPGPALNTSDIRADRHDLSSRDPGSKHPGPSGADISPPLHCKPVNTLLPQPTMHISSPTSPPQSMLSCGSLDSIISSPSSSSSLAPSPCDVGPSLATWSWEEEQDWNPTLWTGPTWDLTCSFDFRPHPRSSSPDSTQTISPDLGRGGTVSPSPLSPCSVPARSEPTDRAGPRFAERSSVPEHSSRTSSVSAEITGQSTPVALP